MGLDRTPLFDLHAAHDARFVPFAGYEMPVQFAPGVMAEHLHCRAAAGLFDVSHMGQVLVEGPDAAAALERVMPQSVADLAEGRQRYGFLTNASGGIIDDLMVARHGPETFLLVVNAACKAGDLAHLQTKIGGDCKITPVTERALVALQGPEAEAALHRLVEIPEMRFLDTRVVPSDFGPLWISRSGYTGEDGFEISVAADAAMGFASALLDIESVAPIGLGARDSLRLEAGLCLYGHDITQDITPIEADLAWAIQKVRRAGGARAGGYPGAERIDAALADGVNQRRVGLLPEGRAPMREGTLLFASPDAAEPIGRVTSGGFAPSLSRPVSMGYLPPDLSQPGTPVFGDVRGKRLPALVSDLPFRPSTYKK